MRAMRACIPSLKLHSRQNIECALSQNLLVNRAKSQALAKKLRYATHFASWCCWVDIRKCHCAHMHACAAQHST